MQQTKIEWTDFTVNFWEGCQKVGPGCDHCYAEARDQRFTGGQHWGPHAPRRKVKGGVGKLLSIQRKAHEFRAEHGHWPRVFCSSLSDVFDNAVQKSWQIEAFATISACTDTRVILLTKRVGNVFQMIPPSWASPELGGWPKHVGLMITVVNQAEADRDIPKLLELKQRLGIPWVGLSMEPLLGPVDLDVRLENMSRTFEFNDFWAGRESDIQLDWIIVGGESGHNARPSNPQWFRDIRDQCSAAGVPFLFKQWGEWVGVSEVEGHGQHHKFEDGRTVRRSGKKIAGRLLDGRTWDQFPEAMA